MPFKRPASQQGARKPQPPPPPKPRRPSPPLPQKKTIGFDDDDTGKAAGAPAKRVNPFAGQTIIKGGKKIDRNPTTSTGGKP